MRVSSFFLLLGLIVCLPYISGCPAVPFIAKDERSFSGQLTDAGIEGEIKGALAVKDPVEAARLNVYSFRGHVFLVGEVPAAFRAVAENKARSVPGVHAVTPHWFPKGTSDHVKDVQIETIIDKNLLFAPNVGSTRVRVDVWGGNVVLLGITESREELQRAVREVSGVDGVKSVTSYLRTNADSKAEAEKAGWKD